MQDLIKNYFTESIQTQIAMIDTLSETIEKAGFVLVESLLNGNKVMSCGNGPSAAAAQCFTAKLMDHFEIERPSIPAIALVADNVLLSSISYRGETNTIYSKQVQALGHMGDVLIAISSDGNSPSIVSAVKEAVIKDMSIIVMTGGDGGELVGLLGQQDIEIRIPSSNSNQIQEMHALVLNCLCRLIEHSLFTYKETSE